MLRSFAALLLYAICVAAAGVRADSLGPAQLGVIVNDADPVSRTVASYYIRKRGIPAANVVRVRIALESAQPDGAARAPAAVDAQRFAELKAEVDAALPRGVQALVLAWRAPYRVECMSMTSAFAFGFDRAYCADGCQFTRPSPYFESDTAQPFAQLRMRPAMQLAVGDYEAGRALIDRGLAASRAAARRGAAPQGRVYLVSTLDAARNVRATPQFDGAQRLLESGGVAVERIAADAVIGRDDVLGYFTGVASVPKLETVRFVPGAAADHLTSAGGDLYGTGQMPATRWLEAGATGSYGTVVEPCNFPHKFPNVRVFARRYYVNGETLLESYWKSVLMPGQGVFVGDPLARVRMPR